MTRARGDNWSQERDIVTDRNPSRGVERRQLIVQLSGRRPSSSKTMTTFSDGGDGLHISNMAGLASYSSSSGDMRFHLQILLDSKEKQLQQAGTLGQQLLAQRMELEERIRMLQDMELDSGEGDDMRDKYRELVDTIRAWDAENEQLSNLFGAKVCEAMLVVCRRCFPLAYTFPSSPFGL